MFSKIIFILFILVTLVILVVRLQGDAYKRFKDGSAEAMGRIEKKETRIDNPKNRRTENVLIYSYSVDGREYRGEEKVEYEDMWLDAKPGMELRVYYSKGNPAKSYPAALIDRRLDIASKL